LTYAAGSSQFTGPVTAPGVPTGGGLAGIANGSFYGPTAQEIGGVFSLNNTVTSGSREAIVGGFGGKR
jgi:C-lobe and N-lobe beta barrels of Tf-binding protein B